MARYDPARSLAGLPNMRPTVPDWRVLFKQVIRKPGLFIDFKAIIAEDAQQGSRVRVEVGAFKASLEDAYDATCLLCPAGKTSLCCTIDPVLLGSRLASWRDEEDCIRDTVQCHVVLSHSVMTGTGQGWDAPVKMLVNAFDKRDTLLISGGICPANGDFRVVVMDTSLHPDVAYAFVANIGTFPHQKSHIPTSHANLYFANI